MVKEKIASSAKRFGVRYGSTLRNKVSRIENTQRQKHKCNVCSSRQVKRVSAGIWQCKKCNAKFAARAYSPKMTGN